MFLLVLEFYSGFGCICVYLFKSHGTESQKHMDPGILTQEQLAQRVVRALLSVYHARDVITECKMEDVGKGNYYQALTAQIDVLKGHLRALDEEKKFLLH